MWERRVLHKTRSQEKGANQGLTDPGKATPSPSHSSQLVPGDEIRNSGEGLRPGAETH